MALSLFIKFSKQKNIAMVLSHPAPGPLYNLWTTCSLRHQAIISSIYEPPHDKTNGIACAPSEDSDQSGHPPSLIRVFAVRMKKAWVLSYPQSTREDSDQTGRMPRLIWVFAQSDQSFAVRMKKAWVLSYTLSSLGRLWSDWAAAQADLSLRWRTCHFVGFVMRRLLLY